MAVTATKSSSSTSSGSSLNDNSPSDHSSSNPFNILPIETVQHIGSHLSYDSDLCHFRLICRSTLDAVDADNCSFWRRRFLDTFEASQVCRVGGNQAFKNAYQKRRGWMKNGAQFRAGETRRERECLEVIRDLMVESFSSKQPNNSEITYTSANLELITRFMLANNLLQIIFEPPKVKASRLSSRRAMPSSAPQTPTQLFYAVQILCAPMLLSLEGHLLDCHFGFPDSQVAVYSTAEKKPFFTGHYGLDVNLELVLQNLNFWKYHMLRQVENTLFQAFSDLDASDRPRWWESQLQNGERTLGKHWKGSYAYIEREEIEALRTGRGDCDQIQDYFAGEDNAHEFQDMTLKVMPEGSAITWPRAFEQVLHSLSHRGVAAKTRAQKKSATPESVAEFKPLSFQFDGEGNDVSEEFLAAGWLNSLPSQQGIPGWQRMTMMKYFESETGEIDVDALWAYEGVVLPGGQIVVGRWWSPQEGTEEEMYSGPFILWCVDGPGWDDDEDEDVQMS